MLIWSLEYLKMFVIVSVLIYCVLLLHSGSSVIVSVTLEREDEVTGPVIAPFYPQASYKILL